MKQKIVIRVVGMNCEKSRCKTLKTVVGCACVESAAVKGDQVEVVGDGIDAVCLTRAIRKNVAPADLISVEEHKKKEEKKDDKPAQPDGNGTGQDETVIPCPTSMETCPCQGGEIPTALGLGPMGLLEFSYRDDNGAGRERAGEPTSWINPKNIFSTGE